MISALKKLKGRSLAEFTDRGRQTVSSLAERVGVSKDHKLPDDRTFLALFGTDGFENFESLLDHFRSREPVLYPSMHDQKATVSALRQNFPEAEARILAETEKICAGRFDLLGFKDLDFDGPIPDWSLEPVAGKRSALVHWSQIDELDTSLSGDKKIVWELNRHQYFSSLGRAYWLSGDERFSEVFIGHVWDWIEMNPPKMGLNWRSSLEVAFRSMSWIWAFYFFCHSPGFTADIFAEMLKVLYLNGRHLEKNLSTYSSPNTHLTGEALGLYALGTFFEETEPGGRWRAKGREVLLDALKFQFREDGGYVEQATQYQRYSADFYLSFLIWETSVNRRVGKDFGEVLQKLLSFLVHITQPDGNTPLIGDDDGGRLHFFDTREFSDFRSTLVIGALMLRDPVMKFVAGEASEEVFWLTGPDGLKRYNELEAKPPAETVGTFQESGFFVGRNGWERDSSYILINCGEHGFLNGAHAHADALGFVLSVKGNPVFIDSGTFNYTADQKAREHYRSTAAHNCVVVNGRSSSTPDGPFSWKTKANSKLLEWKDDHGSILFRGTHDGFEDMGVKYEREISIASWKTMKLIDRFDTLSNNQFNITFILSPAIEAELIEPMGIILRLKGRTEPLVRMQTAVTSLEMGRPDGWRIEPAKISPRYGSELEASRLSFMISSDRPFEIINTFKLA